MELIGSKPSPRVLVFGISADGVLGLFIREVSPTVRYVENEDELSLIRQMEWDAAIVFNDPPSQPALAGHLMVLQFGGSTLTGYPMSNPPAWVQIVATSSSVATEFIIPDPIPSAIHRLAATSLLPLLQSQPVNMVVGHYIMGVGKTLSDKMNNPFVTDADGQMLAGYIEVNNRQWWWLPDNAPDKNTWITSAFGEWSKILPEKFPVHAVWTERPQWQIMEERKAVEDLRNMREERDRVLADFSQRERMLIEQYEHARSEADRAERRLLTAQGADLVDGVKAALEEIGFKVRDADKEFAVKGDLLEDLRVEDPDVQGWISLTEVRGYAGGAKVSDLQRIGRFVERYVHIEGKIPSARWYIVNYSLNTDPSGRPIVLAGSTEDVSIFSDAGGLVIDTRVLFTICDQVPTGVMEPQIARQSLREARGIMGLPTQPGES